MRARLLKVDSPISLLVGFSDSLTNERVFRYVVSVLVQRFLDFSRDVYTYTFPVDHA